MTVRKNFLFEEDVAQHLIDIALKENTTQTQVVKDLIEEKYQEISVKEKLKAFYSFAGSCPGMFVGKSIQSIKADMDV
jgi:hypothetical protein